MRKYIILKTLVCLNLLTCSLTVGFYLPSSLLKFPLTSPPSPHPHLQFLVSFITHICHSSQLQMFFIPFPFVSQETSISLFF